jgi:hypothetical protein
MEQEAFMDWFWLSGFLKVLSIELALFILLMGW